MKDERQRLIQLYTRRLSASLSVEETEELEQLLNHKDAEIWLSPLLYDGWKKLSEDVSPHGMTGAKINDLVASLPAATDEVPEENEEPIPRLSRIHLPPGWWWKAACVAMLLTFGSFFLLQQRSKQQPAQTNTQLAADVAPGTTGAILTLADGTHVVLDSLGDGTITSENGTTIVLSNKQLIYEQMENGSGKPVYNTMSTPRGRQFRLSLPDGTDVWLNSASSIRFPTTFAGFERKVEVTGEVYFEVVKDAARPFRVDINNKAEVEVIGTHFNINAYENENSINTTLLEGSVSIMKNNQSKVLRPGEMAQIANDLPADKAVTDQTIKLFKQVNIDKVMAWKNGLFDFEDASLEDVMRQLERWYDIEVVYENEIPDARFFGQINKQNTLQELLHILEKNEVHLRLENGNRVVVSK